MPAIKKTYEDYLTLAHDVQLDFLHQPNEMPRDVDCLALWRHRPTNTVFRQSYKRLNNKRLHNKPPCREAEYVEAYLWKYSVLADYFEIDFCYDPTVDVAPTNTKDPVKWRNRTNGHIIIASFKELAYSGRPTSIVEQLGLTQEKLDNWSLSIFDKKPEAVS